MNAYKLVKDDLKHFISKGLELDIIANPNVIYKENKIGTEHSFFANELECIKNRHKEYECRKYFCTLLKDDSYFQINYEFIIKSKNKSYLKKMNLCYIPGLDNNENLINEYIRLDYDSETTNSFFHPLVHIHIGFKRNFRLPFNDVMLFSEFCEFVLYLYYPDDFKKLNLNNLALSNTYNLSSYGRLTENITLSRELKKYKYFKVSDL